MQASPPSATRRVTLVLDDEAATEALAGGIAAIVCRGDLVALEGPLGAGKTHFARALVHALQRRAGMPPEEVPSPTFTLVQTFRIVGNGLDLDVWHIDLYRVRDEEELVELGLEEALASAVTLVEWPDRMGALVPDDRLEIRLEPEDGTMRRATLSGIGAWADRLTRLEAAP